MKTAIILYAVGSILVSIGIGLLGGFPPALMCLGLLILIGCPFAVLIEED